MLAPDILSSGVTWASLNIERNLPSENHKLASSAMSGPKTSRHPLVIVVGIKFVFDDSVWMVAIARRH